MPPPYEETYARGIDLHRHNHLRVARVRSADLVLDGALELRQLNEAVHDVLSSPGKARHPSRREIPLRRRRRRVRHDAALRRGRRLGMMESCWAPIFLG